MAYAPEKYLLPTERTVIRVRRHWAILAGDGLQATGLVVGAILFAVIFHASPIGAQVAWWLVLVALLRFGFQVCLWYVERFVVTDQRVIMTSGIITRKVAMMPLAKVTDMTYERSVVGQMLGYGVFIVESAGQDQALSRIDYLPRPDRLYIQVAELLFGKRPAPETDPAPD
ncbi:MAG TPA: PH domain-containing protein [Mycobacteriales bacterium]|nr:PH domain-containing protein [Mycobacteriales bacterium]